MHSSSPAAAQGGRCGTGPQVNHPRGLSGWEAWAACFHAAGQGAGRVSALPVHLQYRAAHFFLLRDSGRMVQAFKALVTAVLKVLG